MRNKMEAGIRSEHYERAALRTKRAWIRERISGAAKLRMHHTIQCPAGNARPASLVPRGGANGQGVSPHWEPKAFTRFLSPRFSDPGRGREGFAAMTAEDAMVEGHERVVLGALMHGYELSITEQDFYSSVNRSLFKTIIALEDRCLLSVQAALERRGELKRIGGPARLTGGIIGEDFESDLM